MRIVLMSLVAIFAGLSVGAVLGWGGLGFHEIGAEAAVFHRPESLAQKNANSPMQGEPVAQVVGSDTYEFGAMQRNATKSHEFEIKNVGSAPLTLEKGASTCKCTIADIAKGDLAPGESVKIHLEWTPKSYSPVFRQSAEIHTNDPMRTTIVLSISGQVTQSIVPKPEVFDFGDVLVNEGKETSINIYDYEEPELRVKDYRFKNPSLASLFEVRTEPLSKEQVKEDNGALSGVRMTITAKPGLPLGPITQEIDIDLDRETHNELQLGVTGTVVSDISVLGGRARFSSKRNLLTLGAVESDEGAEATLYVLVKGPYRDDVEMKIIETLPNHILHAELGEGVVTAGGKIVRHKLTVKVPKGAPSASHRSGEELGKVIIDTTHPQAKRLIIYVDFSVIAIGA